MISFYIYVHILKVKFVCWLEFFLALKYVFNVIAIPNLFLICICKSKTFNVIFIEFLLACRKFKAVIQNYKTDFESRY